MKQVPKSQETVLIPVHVTPKAGRDAVEGYVTDSAGKQWLKVKISAPPEDGKANKALLKLLAKEWGCAPSSLAVASGETSRHKLVRRCL